MSTTNEHVTTMVFAEFRRDDQVAVMIPAREGRGEPTVVAISDNTITWKCADGALERLGTPAAPVGKDVIEAVSSAEGLLVMLGDVNTDELVGDFVLKSEPVASAAAR
ncbi:hypothetical protein K2O51_31730 (plasmid) [Cupriavidus pinatubonensis]|uniref:hypothetical protein n=1 Tax=Cupriavidus pinatubonensis TaxID=248026 RepID=UPI001C73D36A|nr:hypothetical protein [Cupriavidus pinatubonensis]QYY33597.1 hypothetical protein K2O51_31730 [Cupriavidus pinatubonensis]